MGIILNKYCLIGNSWVYKTILVFFIFLIPSTLVSQTQRIIFDHYTVKEGLIYNLVEYAYVDRDGFAWIACITGLQQFDGYEFRSYLPDPKDTNSIAGNFITTIFEDSEGDLWFGTLLHGVNVFNKELEIFESFQYDTESTSSLSSNIIPRGVKSIIEDRDGYIWVNTQNGLNKIDKSTKAVKRYYGDFKGHLIYDDVDHRLWMAHKKLKEFDIRNSNLRYYEIQEELVDDDISINAILKDKDGLIWLGTSMGVIIFNKSKHTFLRLNEYLDTSNPADRDKYAWTNQSISSIYEDHVGSIWLGVGKSMYQLNKNDGTFREFYHEVDNLNSLRDEKVTGIYGNKKGILWISYLNKGLSKVNIKTKQFEAYKHIPNDPNSISGSTVRSIFKDSKNHLWIGTYNNGLNRIIESDSKEIYKYRHHPDKSNTLTSDYITAIYVDSNERLWVGSYESGLSYADNIYESYILEFKRYLPEEILEIHEFTEDVSGRIWISTQLGFYMYNPLTDHFIHYGDDENQIPELKSINIQSVVIEKPNLFWLATWNRGLCKLYINSDSQLSPVVGKDSLIVYDPFLRANNSSIDIGYITIYKERNIWLGSNVNGLVKVDEKPDGIQFINYDKTKGAPDNSVFGIAGDKNGNIWISTGYGIGKFNIKKERFQNYFESDGLLSNVFVWDASFQSKDGEIYFGSVNGLNVFYPDSIKDFNSRPNIYISELIIHNKKVNIRDKINGREILTKNIRYTDRISLTHKEPVFSLEFLSLDNFNTDQIQYAYMLEGFEEDWTYTSSDRRFVSYTNLDPDIYTFRVKSTNSDGIWGYEEASLEIEILPPFWKTWWAYAAYILTLFILLYLLQMQIINMTRLKHDLQIEQLRHERDNELSQMKLNFFTNLSHEIRTPLTLIIGPIERILKSNEGGGKIQQQLRLISKNAKRLFELTNQLLNFKDLEFDKLRLNAAKGNIVKFTKEIVIAFKQQAQIKNIDLNCSFEDKKIELWYDRNKLEVVIYNILSNAFKFTPRDGHILVSITMKNANNNIEENPEGINQASFGQFPGKCIDWVEISIKDSGPGISGKHIDNIFQRYYQVDKLKEGDGAGFGIGLEQAKNLVVAHSGILKVISKEGIGSEFTICLPIGKDHLAESEIISDFKNSEHIDHYRFPEIGEEDKVRAEDIKSIGIDEDKYIEEILIIDDNPDILKYLDQILQPDYKIIEALDGKSGFDSANEKIPDLIISDVMMPGMDGLELCRRLKSNARTSHIPVFLLTARTSLLYQIEGFDMGADDYITKPFNEKTLKTRIRNVLNTRRKLRDQFRREFILRPKDIAITTPDERFLEELLKVIEENVSDPEFNVEKLSREMAMSHSLIYKKLISLTGLTIVEFIRSIRLNCAAQMFAKLKLPVSEVSVAVGFNDPKYFSKCFQKQFNKTPTEYLSEYHT
jgi:signal transduction histidine kinase/DNA-binding response OmpR family regulator/streptogramin lyase